MAIYGFLSPNPLSNIWWKSSIYTLFLLLMAFNFMFLLMGKNRIARGLALGALVAITCGNLNMNSDMALLGSRGFWAENYMPLFFFIVLLDFTGYILRWDQGIQWALVVGTNLVKSIPMIGNSLYQMLVGGDQPGAAPLIRFYTWHVFGLMLLAAILTIWHAFRVRRDGGIAVPPPQLRRDQNRISRFELLRRESAAMLLTGAGLLLLSAFCPAPIAPAITEITALSGETHAPWFFLWVQQMLKWGDPFLLGVLVPVLVLILLAFIPYIFPQPAEHELGGWFPKSNRLAQVVLAVVTLLIIILILLALSPVVE